MTWVIFSIDNVTNVHSLAKFLRHMDTKNALSEMVGKLVTCIGSYKGVMEYSFICNRKDYEKHVLPLAFTKGQESVLLVGGEEMSSALFDPSLSKQIKHIGTLKSVSKEEAIKHDCFTYRPDLDKYWVSN